MCSTCSGIWWQSTLKTLVTTEAQPVFAWCQRLASSCAPTTFSLFLSWQHGMCIIFRKVASACCGIWWQSTLKIIVTSPGARGLLPGVLQLLSHPCCPGGTVCTSSSERWFATCSTHSGIRWRSTLTVIATTEAQHVLTWCQWLYCHVCSTVPHYVLAA